MTESEANRSLTSGSARPNKTVMRFVVRNAVAATSLLAIWIMLDLVDVMAGQSYQPSKSSAAIMLAVMALTFAVTTWFALPTVAIGLRTLLTVVTAAIFTVAEAIIGTFIVIYFHVMIGGHL